MIALVDVDSMYASCEESWNPALKGKPVVVLSNNDGCVVARSAAAKKLGVKMGQPLFELKELQEKSGLICYSSNYVLYGSLSARIMKILARFVERVEVYSIDEAFLDLKGYETIYPDFRALGLLIKKTIRQWTRLPVSIGIAPTFALAKVAVHKAKHEPEQGGVVLMDDQDHIESILSDFPVDELWGIGPNYTKLLHDHDIQTALQFRNIHDVWIQKHMTVNGLRLAYELRGKPCRMVEVEPARRKSVGTSPSFGKVIGDLESMKQALSHYVVRLVEKLRKQHLAAGAMTIFVHTNPFRKSDRQYYKSRSFALPIATNLIPELLYHAHLALDSVYKPGYNYQKVGIILSALSPESHQATDLFEGELDPRLLKLANVMDKVNKRYGRSRLRFAIQDYKTEWGQNQKWMSPCYTTRWTDILQTIQERKATPVEVASSKMQ